MGDVHNKKRFWEKYNSRGETAFENICGAVIRLVFKWFPDLTCTYFYLPMASEIKSLKLK